MGVDTLTIDYDNSGRSNGNAFLFFQTEEEARDAQTRCNGMKIGGKVISIDGIISKEPPRSLLSKWNESKNHQNSLFEDERAIPNSLSFPTQRQSVMNRLSMPSQQDNQTKERKTILHSKHSQKSFSITF